MYVYISSEMSYLLALHIIRDLPAVNQQKTMILLFVYDPRHVSIKGHQI